MGTCGAKGPPADEAEHYVRWTRAFAGSCPFCAFVGTSSATIAARGADAVRRVFDGRAPVLVTHYPKGSPPRPCYGVPFERHTATVAAACCGDEAVRWLM